MLYSIAQETIQLLNGSCIQPINPGSFDMTKKYAVLFLVCVLGWIPASMLAQDPQALLVAVSKSMGADNLKTLQFSGMGSGSATIGQNVNPKTAWPVARIKSYSYEADFVSRATRRQFVRQQNGADQAVNEYISADSPWNTQYDYWLSPFAFIKAAIANNGTVRSETADGARYSVVTFALQGKYKFIGYINEQNLVERVQTWIDNDVMGDMLAESWYSLYKDFGGIKFPTSIVEKQAGFPVLILAVSDVKANAAVVFPPQPPAANSTSTPSVSVQAEKIADGVFYLKGGTHHSIALEFSDYIAMIDAPLNEQRSLAVIAEVKKAIPGKPIRYVINTHHHFDHSGGLRTYVDEGATVITQEMNREFFERTLSPARTLNPDRLARSQKKAVIETVAEKKVLTDGARTVEIHLIKDNPHSDGMLMVFLPKEKMVIEADVFTPPAAAAVNRSTVNFVDNLERLKLDFEKVIPLHGAAAASRGELYAAAKRPVPDMAELVARTQAPAGGQRGQRGQAAGGQPAAAGADGRAQELLQSVCVACHNLNRVQTKNLVESDWRLIVDRMKDRGAELSDEDVSALISYLAKTYGPKQ
jgi:glyoxylase-like metal-dependent hydrolase (beta-lactamase superfamily II)